MSTYIIRDGLTKVTTVEAESGHEAIAIYAAGTKIQPRLLNAIEKPIVLPHDEDGVQPIGSHTIVGYRARCRCNGRYWRGPAQDERVFAQADLQAHREEFQS